MPRMLILALLSVLAVAACGDGGEADRGSKTEKAFLSAMVPHHESAVAMAREALPGLRSSQLKRIARDIIATQPAEVAQMCRIHRRRFGAALKPDMGGHAALGLSAKEAGMDHMDGARVLAKATDVDRAFVSEMVPHHAGAVAMAQALLREPAGLDLELWRLAERIVAAQRGEIDAMRRVVPTGR